MIPYDSPLYLLILFILFIPMMIGLALGKRFRVYQNVISIYFLWISFAGDSWKQGIALIIYVLWQVLLTQGYLQYRKKKNDAKVFYLAVVLSILPLVLDKIFPFFHVPVTFIGFLGISYLTFKSVGMIMEMRDGMLKEAGVLETLEFLLFFPTISSGPIDRFRRFTSDMKQQLDPMKYAKMVQKGIFYLFLGMLYKYIIAMLLHLHVMPVVEMNFVHHLNFEHFMEYMYAYGFYLFFDFAGYSLFAVGASYLLGIESPMNFHYPFVAPNIKDFWNRWHISLSFWFRDYVYMRLVYLFIKKKIFKNRITTSNVAYFGLFGLMGLWHGLTWYYIVYGIYHACLICVTDMWIRFKRKHKDKIPSNRATHVLAIVLTFHAVFFSFLIFSGILDKLF
jgi:membrane protein involved in D-alanine export